MGTHSLLKFSQSREGMESGMGWKRATQGQEGPLFFHRYTEMLTQVSANGSSDCIFCVLVNS